MTSRSRSFRNPCPDTVWLGESGSRRRRQPQRATEAPLSPQWGRWCRDISTLQGHLRSGRARASALEGWLRRVVDNRRGRGMCAWHGRLGNVGFQWLGGSGWDGWTTHGTSHKRRWAVQTQCGELHHEWLRAGSRVLSSPGPPRGRQRKQIEVGH